MDTESVVCWGIAFFFLVCFLAGIYIEINKEKIKARKIMRRQRRPTLLKRPFYWPGMHQYDKAMKLSEKILLWPLNLGVMGNTWIINLWLASIIIIPMMIPFATPVWLYALSKHWFWYRLRNRTKK